MSDVPKRPPWTALWGALGIVIAWHCWFASYNHDEIEHLHAAWLISIGQLPYRDFLEQHHPTIWFIASPIVARFQSAQWLVFAARLFDLTCLLGVCAIVKRLLQRLYPDVPWQWPTLLLLASCVFVRSSLEFRPDPLMNLLSYAGLLNWVAFIQEKSYFRALAAGIFFGAAVAILQKAFVVLGLVFVGAAILAGLRLWRRQSIERLVLGAGLALLAAAIPVAALLWAMRRLGIYEDFWFWNYPFNAFFYLRAHLHQHFSALQSIGLNVAVAPALWLAGGVGAGLCARELTRTKELSARDECRLSLLCVALGYFGLLCLNRFPLDQYFIVLLPLLGLFAAEAFSAARSKRQQVILAYSALCMPVILVSVLLLYPSNREQRVVQDLVLRQTSIDQAIFIPPAFNPIFRKDGAYFWYNGDLISRAYEDFCHSSNDCRGDKLFVDEQRWQSSPPTFVFLELPQYYPYHWQRREAGYFPTQVPHLWTHRRTIAGIVSDKNR